MMTAVHGTMSRLKLLMVVAVLLSWTVHAVPSEENAASAEQDSPKNVTTGSRCIGCLIKRIVHPKRPPSTRHPTCPKTDLSDVISIVVAVKEKLYSMTKELTVISELRESVTQIINRETDTTRIEKIIEKHYERIRETVRSEIINVRENVETRVVPCSGSSDGSTKRLESKIDDLAKNLELLKISQSESQEQISQTIVTFSSTLQQLVKNVEILTYNSRKAVTPQTCPESPGIRRLLEICQVILTEFRDRIDVVSTNIVEVQTKVVNIAASFSNIVSSGQKQLPDLSKLWEYLEKLIADIGSLKNSIAGEFTAIRMEFRTNSQVLSSIKQTVTTTTQETSSAAASAAVSAVKRLAGRGLCPKQE